MSLRESAYPNTPNLNLDEHSHHHQYPLHQHPPHHSHHLSGSAGSFSHLYDQSPHHSTPPSPHGSSPGGITIPYTNHHGASPQINHPLSSTNKANSSSLPFGTFYIQHFANNASTHNNSAATSNSQHSSHPPCHHSHHLDPYSSAGTTPHQHFSPSADHHSSSGASAAALSNSGRMSWAASPVDSYHGRPSASASAQSASNAASDFHSSLAHQRLPWEAALASTTHAHPSYGLVDSPGAAPLEDDSGSGGNVRPRPKKRQCVKDGLGSPVQRLSALKDAKSRGKGVNSMTAEDVLNGVAGAVSPASAFGVIPELTGDYDEPDITAWIHSGEGDDFGGTASPDSATTEHQRLWSSFSASLPPHVQHNAHLHHHGHHHSGLSVSVPNSRTHSMSASVVASPDDFGYATASGHGGAPSNLGLNVQSHDDLGSDVKMESLARAVPDAHGGDDAGTTEDEPLYVNAKQYQRIIKRRAARARIDEQRKKTWLEYMQQQASQRHESRSADGDVLGLDEDARKSYLHESRHRHAVRRPRGPGGRFLQRSPTS